MESITNKIVSIRTHMIARSRHQFGNLKNKIQTTKKELTRIRSQKPLDYEKEMEIASSLDKLVDLDELYLRQCSRSEWLSAGHRNTKYFHKVEKNIFKLINDEGNVVISPEGINEVVVNFYKTLFTSTGQRNIDMWGLPLRNLLQTKTY